MKKTIFLFSKDALSKDYLPTYGNTFWSTPNIDALAKKGTVFYNHHTAAVSTSMAFSSMLTGKYSHEFTDRKVYCAVKEEEQESIFSVLQKEGYDCHILWSIDYMTGAYPYVREFGDENKTKIHIVDMHVPVGRHRKKGEKLLCDDNVIQKTYENITNELLSIEKKDKQFIWLHLPHVLKGKNAYGSDVDVVDKLLGFVRERYGDENIYFTADHSNMNFHKNIMGYGFHVYEKTACVPLIVPKIDGIDRVDFLTSHIDLKTLLLDNKIVKRDYVIIDSQYYCQPNRKVAVLGARYKYIYNKKTDTEELYDIVWDNEENINLLEDERFDLDRVQVKCVKEMYFYPYFNQAETEYKNLKQIFNGFYKKGGFKDEFICKLKRKLKEIKGKRVAVKQLRENRKKKNDT